MTIGCDDSPPSYTSQPTTSQAPPDTSKLPYYQSAEFTPHWLSKEQAAAQKVHSIRPFTLTNQHNEPITQDTFKNKIYVTNFFFTTCPGICLKMTENLKIVQDAYQDDAQVMFLSHSVTPKEDTPDILQAYARKHGMIKGKWHLATGDRKEIYDLGRKVYFIEENMGQEKSDADFLHTENFLLIDQNRHIRGIYNGLKKSDVHQLIADIKQLQTTETL